MFKLSNIYVTIAAIVLSTLGGAYLAYKYQKNHYEAKITKIEASYAKEIAKQKEEGDKAVARYTENLRAELGKTKDLERQLRQVSYLGSGSGTSCRVSYGFIRLFNASATGEITAPSEFDSTTSTIELDTVLSTILDNHGKYREAIRQVNAIIETLK